MRKRPTARFVNGVVSAIIVVFFAAHGVMGSASAFMPLPHVAAWLVWIGVALVVVHVVLSVVTSQQQLSDRERPPSRRKKRHLALKWATGAILAAAACVHFVPNRLLAGSLPQYSAAGEAVIAVVAVVLAIHICVGAKSLLKDIGADRRYKLAFRIVVCLFAAAFAIIAMVLFVQAT